MPTEKELRESLAKGGLAADLIDSIVQTQITAGLCKAETDPLNDLDPAALDRHLEEVAKALDSTNEAARLAKAEEKCCGKCGGKVDEDGKATSDDDGDEDEEEQAAKGASMLRAAGLFKALEIVGATHRELVKAVATSIQTVTSLHAKVGELEKAVAEPRPGKAVVNVADVVIQPPPGEQIAKGTPAAPSAQTVPTNEDRDKVASKIVALIKASDTTSERREELKKAARDIDRPGSDPAAVITKYGL
jgi:hypothetical protein